MMKIKKNGKTILVSILVIFLFSVVVVWHDRVPSKPNLYERNEIIQTLSALNGDLKKLVAQHKDTSAFYCVGMQGANPMPSDLMRACYFDPLAAQWQFSQIKQALASDLKVIRYRSMGDFLVLLLEAEHQSPGMIARINFNALILIKEDVLAISCRSVLAMVIVLLGLLVANMVNPEA